MSKVTELSMEYASHLQEIEHINTEFSYNLAKGSYELGYNSCENELLKLKIQCQKWKEDSEKMADIFSESQMQSSLISSQAMAQAYWNVIQFIEVNFS